MAIWGMFIGLWLACANAVPAQPADEYLSGLLHQPLGGITAFSLSDRRLSACCLGSTGEDGVEVRFASVHGGGFNVDLSGMLEATGVAREIRVRPKGWDGTIKGNLRIASDADGVLTEEFDFSTIGATAVEWRLLDQQGGLLQQGTVAGPVLAWGLEVTPTPGAAVDKRMALRPAASGYCASQGFFDVAVTVTGLTGTPVADVHTIEATPIPASPWNDLYSVEVTGADLPELVVADAYLTTFQVESWGVGQARLAEECIGFPPPCAGAARGLVATNLGNSGEDGVALDFGPGASGGALARSRCTGCPPGHVIIMKLYDDGGQEIGRLMETSNPGTGQGILLPDYSAVGSSEFDVAYLGANGLPLALERCSNGVSLEMPNPDNACTNGPPDIWVFSADSSHVIEKRFCQPTGELVLPSGAAVSGVNSIRLRAVEPQVAHHAVRRALLTSPDPDPIAVEWATAFTPVFASGIGHYALGGVDSLSVEGRRLFACCLGSSGEDGVELRFDSIHGGGATVDVTPLLGATGVQREIRVRPKGWDGTVKGQLRLTSDPGGVLTEVYDFSTIGASAVEWRLLNVHGGVLAEGGVAGPVITWGLEAEAGSPLNKLFAMASGAAGFDANQGFFDRVVSVSGLTPDPVQDVHAIEVTPVQPCAGCPNGPPFNDLHALAFKADGMPELVLADAHLRTFGLQCSGVGQAHLSEECANPLLPCDGMARQLVVDNLGSLGQDGVRIDLGGGSSGGEVAYRGRCKGCPPGHVIIMKLYDDGGGEAFRATQAEDPLSALVTLTVDAGGQGSTDTLVTLYDANGGALAMLVHDAATSLEYPACSDEAAETWSWSGNHYAFHPCSDSPFTLPGGAVLAGVASVTFEPAAPSTPRAASIVEMTSNDPSGLVVERAAAAPAAAGDINRDGYADLLDHAVFAACLAGPGRDAPPPVCDALRFQRCDLDADVDVDLIDFALLQQALPGG